MKKQEKTNQGSQFFVFQFQGGNFTLLLTFQGIFSPPSSSTYTPCSELPTFHKIIPIMKLTQCTVYFFAWWKIAQLVTFMTKPLPWQYIKELVLIVCFFSWYIDWVF